MPLPAHTAVSNSVVGLAGAPAARASVPRATRDQPKNGQELNFIINSLDRQWALGLSAYNEFGSLAQKPRNSPLASETYRRMKYWYFRKEQPVFDEALDDFAKIAPRLHQKNRLSELCGLFPPIESPSSAKHQRLSRKSIFDKVNQHTAPAFKSIKVASFL
jgi:hypothetical protein